MHKIAPSPSAEPATQVSYGWCASPLETNENGSTLIEPSRSTSMKSLDGWAFIMDLITLRVFFSSKSRHRNVLRHYLGFPYVAITLFLSIRFLMVSQSSLQNDLFWSDFNSTSGGIYVANVFNTILMGRQQAQLKLTDPTFAVYGTLATVKPQVTFSSLYINVLLFHRLNTADHAIAALRHQESSYRMLYKQNQFCWVDFDRRFSLAHTAKRAERCLANDRANGAVYFESYLRNLDAFTFLSMWNTSYYAGIRDPLSESPQGRAFINGIESIWTRSVHLSTQQELAYWQSKGITHFTMQWGNFELPGITERIELVSGLGVRVNFTIKTTAAVVPGLQTSVKMFWTPGNDLWAVDNATTSISGMSLVRGTTNFYENFNISMEQVMIDDGDIPYPFTPTDQILRQVLGPFGSIDMKHVLFADSLFVFVMNATARINQKLLGSPQAQHQFSNLPERKSFAIIPASWRSPEENTWGYVGGSPLCSGGVKVPYIQKSLDYTDSCSTGSVQELARETRLTFVLALLAVGNPGADEFEAICSAGLSVSVDCMHSLELTSEFVNTNVPEEDQKAIRSLALNAHRDMVQVNPEMIQFVVNNSNDSHYELLRQPIMNAEVDDLWNFWGWWFAYEWAAGSREVVRFEGDEGSLTLLSARILPATLDIRGTEIPASMAGYFLRIVQYTTVVSILCACLALLYTLTSRGHIAGANLLKFNRVTSAVWIGRPLVLARGIVAVCMISTSDVFLKLHFQMTKFEETKKAWYNVLITAGESCWFSYVTVDLFVTATQGYTYLYASVSSVLVQVINAMIDFVMPFEHTAEIDVQCEMVVFYQEISCRSGRVAIGNPWRFLTISGVAIAITILTYVVLRLTTRPAPVFQGGEVLLSGIAKEVFVTEDWIHDGRWYLDKASALLSGLVTLNFGGCSRVLEVKSWTLLYLKRNRLYSVKPRDSSRNTQTCRSIQTQTSTKRVSELPSRLKYAIALVLHIGGSQDIQESSFKKSGRRAWRQATSTKPP